MLQFMILLFILCTVPGNSFPQRNNPNFDGNFDSYMEHYPEFPSDETFNVGPRVASNQDYQYIPLLGEMPDYIPPILQRGHFTHPNIPRKSAVKERAWHSYYQDGNFPHAEMEHAANGIRPQNPMQNRREWNRQTKPHLQMQDFGPHEAPVVVEAILKNGQRVNKIHDHKVPFVEEPSKRKPVFIKEHHRDPVVKPIINEDYNTPKVAEALDKKWSSGPINLAHKQPGRINYKKNKHESFPEDYEEPVVMGAWTKRVSPTHNRKHSHKKPVMKHEKRPIIKHDQNHGVKTEIPIRSGYFEDYDTPLVVEAFTKEKLHASSSHGHKPFQNVPVVKKAKQKNQILQPDWKPIDTTDPEDYETPVVIEVLTKKESVPSKKYGGKKRVEHAKNQTDKPVGKPTFPNYKDDYDTPVVVEALTKEGIVHKKEHGHKKLIEVDQVKKHENNPIVEPAEKPVRPSYPNDYDLPVVVEALTKEGIVHKKEHGHKIQIKTKEVVKEHQKTPIIEPVGKPVGPSYPDDYDLPIVVEALTKEGIVHKKEHGHKKPIKADIVIEKHGKYPIIKPSHKMDYEAPVVVETWTIKGSTINKENNRNKELKHGEKKEDYGKSVKSLKKPMDVEYGSENSKGLDVSMDQAQWPKNQFEDSEIKRFKRHVELHDEDDYDLPVVIGVETRASQAARRKSTLVEPEDQEYDYDLPVVIKVETKEIVTSHKTPEFMEPIDREANYDLVVDQTSKVDEEYDPNNEKKPPKNQNNKLHKTQNEKASTKDERGAKKQGHENVDKIAKGKPNMGKKQSKKHIAINKGEIPIDEYNQNAMKHKNRPTFLPTRIDPNEDGYEKPVDKYTDVDIYGYEIDAHERPVDYFEDNSVMEENPIHDSFEPIDISDTEDVLDSLSINREGPEGREIPVVDVLAVKDHENEPNAGIRVMTFNKDNGNVDVINIGHEDSNHNIEGFEDSNHIIEDFEDSGSGVDLDERSSVPRSLFPMNSNSWSFMTHIQAQERQKFKPCFTPRNETGNCMPIQMCPIPNLNGPIDDFLRNICIIDEVFIGICCPEFPVESVRVDWGQLGNSNPEPLVDNAQASRESLECGKLPSSFQSEDSWPWMAPLISTTSDRVFCGGALINEQYVLTAAHCTSRIPRNRILVRLGSPDLQTGAVEFTVVEIKRHAQYNPKTMQNDLALLKLARKVPLGNFRRLVCIPDEDEGDNVGESAVLLRWHRNPDSGVESLPVISNQECQNKLGTLIGDSMLCTEPRNEETTCNADSGAPLVASSDGKFKIIGVLTWNRNDCDGRYPSVFTRISSYQRWIKNHAN